MHVLRQQTRHHARAKQLTRIRQPRYRWEPVHPLPLGSFNSHDRWTLELILQRLSKRCIFFSRRERECPNVSLSQDAKTGGPDVYAGFSFVLSVNPRVSVADEMLGMHARVVALLSLFDFSLTWLWLGSDWVRHQVFKSLGR